MLERMVEIHECMLEHAPKEGLMSPFWIRVCGGLGQRNHVIIVTWTFLKSSVVKMFSIHTKTQSRCFQIPSVLRALFP